jgi:hypothetical protein
MNKKGMTPMDMRLLLTLLEAIECICTYEKGKLDTFEKIQQVLQLVQEREETPWYRFYGPCSQESLL